MSEIWCKCILFAIESRMVKIFVSHSITNLCSAVVCLRTAGRLCNTICRDSFSVFDFKLRRREVFSEPPDVLELGLGCMTSLLSVSAWWSKASGVDSDFVCFTRSLITASSENSNHWFNKKLLSMNNTNIGKLGLSPPVNQGKMNPNYQIQT